MSNTNKSPKARTPKGKGITLNVNTQFIEEQDKCQSNNKEIPPTNIYSFSSHGKLISKDRIKGAGTSRITLDAQIYDTITLAVGPDLPKEIETLEELKRYKPEVKRLKIAKDVLDIDFLLPPHQWLCWYLSRCVVPGNVYKDYGDDAPTQDYPIGNATVEIYEVDPFRLWLPKVPDSIIDKLKDRIINIPEPINPPIPPIDFRDIPEPIPFPPLPKPRFGTAVKKGDGFNKIRMLSTLPEYKTLQVEAKTQNNFEFRQTLLAKPKLILPFLCYYFPYIVSMQKLTEATTDDCGKFTGVFYRGCNNTDKPDLYFKVKQQVPGKGEVTIYEKKPVSCYTYWNYRCGTEVTLRSTHPDAIANSRCEDMVPGNYVVFKTVGITGMHRIFGCGASGTTGANKGLLDLYNPGSPFGGGLYFSADFSPSLRANGIRYYKLSVKGPSTGGMFIPLSHEMFRYYTDDSSVTPVFKSYSLGPGKDGFADLCEIPDTEAPNNTPWQNGAGSMHYNSLSIGYWDTVKAEGDAGPSGNAGNYEIQMQLYDASGNEVDIGSGDFYYLLATDGSVADPVEHNNAKDFNLIKVESGAHPSLVFELHIDNNQCVGNIQAPNISGVAAGECCGTLDYNVDSAPITLPFVASHPNGFANYAFRVKRSAVSLSSLNKSGTAIMPGNFNQTGLVSTLMSESLPSSCSEPCRNAAFAEHLHVNAWATNGIHQLSGYDAHDFRAFALMETDES